MTIPRQTTKTLFVLLWEQKIRVCPTSTCHYVTNGFKIPLLGKIESLNVSVAAGILIYEAVKQRGFTTEE